MKYCPKCERRYDDETLNFCLEDGEWLRENRAPDEPVTAVMPEGAIDENLTRPQLSQTGQTLRHTEKDPIATTRPRRIPLPAIVAIVAVAAAGFASVTYRYFSASEASSSIAFDKLRLTKLTRAGKVITTAISPDGKYFAHVTSEGGQHTLLVRQTSANNDIVIVPAAQVEYWGVTFSQNSENIYYVTRPRNGPGVLYKIPTLGGAPQKVMERLDSPISFSPDGKQFAFVRGDFPESRQSALMIANADGTGERAIATRTLPARFYPIYFAGPSWSPDGTLIAAAADGGFDSGKGFNVVTVDVSDGNEALLAKDEWAAIGQVRWVADSSGLIMIAREQGAPSVQVWYLSASNGRARRLTNDLNSYRSLSITADSSKIVSAQIARLGSLWITAAFGPGPTRQISQLAADTILGLSWTPDGSLIYFEDSQGDALGETHIWTMSGDGSQKRPLTVTGANRAPAVSPDGTRIAFTSRRQAVHGVWIMDIDGGHQRALTESAGDADPVFSGDGRWVIFSSSTRDKPGLWRVSIDGGDAVLVAEGVYHKPNISPDGKAIAALSLDTRTNVDQRPDKIVVLPSEGGAPIKTFRVLNNASAPVQIQWSADGKSIVYNQVEHDVGNLWIQPMDGGEPKRLTAFEEHFIFAFAVSKQGSEIAISRGTFVRDAILLSATD